jgi:hypothetical protein
MSRQKNDLPTVPLRISTTQHVRTLLEKLVSTGLFGKNAPEAADRLLSEKLRELSSKGLMPAD